MIFGRLSGPVARQSNVAQYTTPTFAGFNATLSYSPNSESAQAGANTDARIWGATARWSGGPFGAQIDWAQNTGASPAVGARPEATGLKVLGGWQYMPGAQISAIWIRLDNDIGTAASGTIPGPQAGFSVAGDSLRQDGWGLSWEHTFGNIQALAQYGQLGNVKGCGVGGNCSNTKATSYMVGAR